MNVHKGDYFLYHRGTGHLVDLVVAEEDGTISPHRGVEVRSLREFLPSKFSARVVTWRAYSPSTYTPISPEEAVAYLMS